MQGRVAQILQYLYKKIRVPVAIDPTSSTMLFSDSEWLVIGEELRVTIALHSAPQTFSIEVMSNNLTGQKRLNS